jgi:serine phosphatase RsbU (regulator of sigma subunit)
MVLFTDGVVEAMNATGDQFEMARLCAAIEEAHAGSPAAIREHIVSKVSEWTHRQEDDVTVLVARYTADRRPPIG